MDKIKLLINNDLNKVENKLKISINSSIEPFSDLSEFIQKGSKRIRSVLCLLYLRANNIDISDDIINLLTAAELIHNASLIHDDVIDNSDVRRGKQSLFGKYDSKLSVLLGDYILSLAVEKLLLINNSNIMSIFLDITKQMSNAEIVQYLNRNNKTQIKDYLDIIEGKTAVLFAGTLESSAILANLNSEFAKNIGKNFGIIFQINNDLNEKSRINDTKNGVKTIVDILGVEKTQILKDNYKKELRDFLIEVPENIYKQGIEDLVNLL